MMVFSFRHVQRRKVLCNIRKTHQSRRLFKPNNLYSTARLPHNHHTHPFHGRDKPLINPAELLHSERIEACLLGKVLGLCRLSLFTENKKPRSKNCDW